ncbi:hypothetical protein [Variovorax sp. tm]|uniref:hypothetical protein n=1 Tax=Variovorax atrisoli TaxID=3394203 RepID=UPI003A7F94B6
MTQTEKVEHVKQTIDALAECAAVLPQAMAFTYTVERFMRGDEPPMGVQPATEAEVAEAMYALRAAIANARGQRGTFDHEDETTGSAA